MARVIAAGTPGIVWVPVNAVPAKSTTTQRAADGQSSPAALTPVPMGRATVTVAACGSNSRAVPFMSTATQ